MREGGREEKVRVREISVGLDRLLKPHDRLLVFAGHSLRHARVTHPGESPRIPRTDAESRGNMRFCLFEAPDKHLPIPDESMGVRKIWIQIQRMLTSGDTLGDTLSEYIDKSKPNMPVRMVWSQGQGRSQFGFGRGKGREGIGREGHCAFERMRRSRSDERIDVLGIGCKREIEEFACLHSMVKGNTSPR
jgi:hypothetical protein